MKWFPITFVIVALLNITACSGSRSSEGEANAASSALANEELSKLQGTWRIESSMWNGVEDPEIAKSVTIHFQGDKFIVVDIDGKPQQETVKLMPEHKPKAIDCTSKGGGQANPGIYSLDGDTFKWCAAGGGNKVRPTTFESKPGSKQSLLVLRRNKG
jgi:uncharacterized protein (TIGR03067 family)